MDGYIALHRKIIDSWIWQDPEFYRLWSYCLIKASFKEREIFLGQQIVKLNPGQFVIGREKLEEAMNIGLKNKRTAVTWWRRLQKLEKAQMLNIKSYNKFSVVTIENWGFYQGSDIENEQQNEQQTNNKRTTDVQQTITNNKDNKEKNEKNDNKDNNKRQNKFDEVHLSLANLLFEMIKENNPEEREPKLEKWANDIRIMIEQDNRDTEKVKNAIIWSQKNDFWCGVIKSPSSLRRNYDKMATQRNKPVANKPAYGKYNKNQKQEVLPDWLDKTEKQPENKKTESESSGDLEKKVAEIKAKLAERNEVQT
ncbi:hypothetical protein CAX72_13755 [Listeria monocytogenes]|uniref:hypothetical protein n=1 Tax=Listeria monocytogenes TaxID=1639 RepID=UPI0003590FA2|nr:hypothetical protein [Listeria monocytogenes]AGR02064.1 replication protein [Listeria monocytogenes]EAC3417799.1 hypothetical protein [Listeria monocytogenes]EAC4100501.1 hypothetical protein [Listeria monocytogenes]EAC6798231.1 hypothetical protein [Listeria monocytogenes]EAC7054188.1 hypothetical protein [Listeria monocytogenes]